ncbi:hypothetical protein [Enterococcus diestrammenae]|uniref:Uncharacterized protein n=1 Tax=Enterococcus diestrammenae TaxID=1155073 RepID=A0ABV0F4C3_9ENTE|nr:hypothetical protein [Enterococcus diestrammenae]KAF1298790.1 hypothetical protein BAU18_05975 [Enterococcus diestrammenae]
MVKTANDIRAEYYKQTGGYLTLDNEKEFYTDDEAALILKIMEKIDEIAKSLLSDDKKWKS